MNIFGFQIKRKKDEEVIEHIVQSNDDGSVVLTSNMAAYYSAAIDMDTVVKNENDLIRRYREISHHPECDTAIDEIVNEAICVDDQGSVAGINLESLNVNDTIKKKIRDEFDTIKYLLDFDVKAYDRFRSWYIDGRQYFIISLNAEKPKDGILKIDFVDPRKIRKVKEVTKKKNSSSSLDIIVNVDEFFVYNENGIDASTRTQGVKLSIDSVVYCPSGLYDPTTGLMYSYLHKVIKPVNQLKMLEDATVIYRLARAPERRVFYIDVGNLPKIKAEQYVTDLMNKFKNKIVYDASTGEVTDRTRHSSMIEDFYLPRREGGKGTEIQTLPSGQNLGQIDDLEFFQKKVYQSLNVPISRLVPQQNFSLGRSNEITREEVKFHKFISRLQNQYGQILIDLLRVQLIAKNIIRADDWEEVEKNICVEFVKDNNFVEMKSTEMMMNRFAALQQIEGFVGKWVSEAWVRRNILKLTEEEITDIENQIKTEKDVDQDIPDEQEE